MIPQLHPILNRRLFFVVFGPEKKIEILVLHFLLLVCGTPKVTGWILTNCVGQGGPHSILRWIRRFFLFYCMFFSCLFSDFVWSSLHISKWFNRFPAKTLTHICYKTGSQFIVQSNKLIFNHTSCKKIKFAENLRQRPKCYRLKRATQWAGRVYGRQAFFRTWRKQVVLWHQHGASEAF